MIQKIAKRNGDLEDFDRSRIESAVLLAADAVGEVDKSFIPTFTDNVIRDMEHVFTELLVHRVPSVEDVQDIVERNLVRSNRFEMAKAYILYREKRREEREEKHEKLAQQFEKHSLMVTKAHGDKERFDAGKLRKIFDKCAVGFESECRFEDLMEAFKKNLVEDIKTSDINKLLIKACIDLVSVENIAWQHVAARFLLGSLYKQATKNRKISMAELYSPESFAALMAHYVERGFYYKDFYKFYTKKEILEAGKFLVRARDEEYEYTTILSLAKRYLLNPNKVVWELPQEMYLAIALFLAIPEKKEDRLAFAKKIYDACSTQKISLPTPTLINARTNYHQLSSCFKINVDDDLRGIYHAVENMAQISKFGGGVGVYLGNIRSRGSAIRGIGGMSGGVNPWTKVINDTAVAVNQLGARLGAISVTLDIWHLDIHDFLDLQTETGDIRSKAFDVFPAVSVPDLFMRRLEADGDWTLFDPHEVETLHQTALQDHFGTEFDALYERLEGDDRLTMKKTVKAKELFKQFLKAVVETGMPYVFFRDTVNQLNPNKHAGNIYSTQLCTEICQNTSASKFVSEAIEDGKIVIRYEPGDLVVCNLASINVAKVHTKEDITETFPIAMRVLDNVITLNFYPIKEAERTALRYRSVGLGYLGLAEYLATRKLSYDSQEARVAVEKLFEQYAFSTYRASVDLAKERGTYALYKGSEYEKGVLLGRKKEWFAKHTDEPKAWETLFVDMKKHGVRFAYHTAPAPNTSTAGVVGTTAALLPIYKRYFVETNLSAPTIRVAPKLSKENFWYYKEYIHLDMNDVIEMIATIYPWVDQSISFEWMIDPARVSPADLYGYYLKSWKSGIKTVYYVRSLSGEVKDDCVSCSG